MAKPAPQLGRVRATFASLVGAVATAAGVGLSVFPAHAGKGPRLDDAWLGGAVALSVAAILAAWIARPRVARPINTIVLLGLLPAVLALSLLMPVLAFMEPAVRDALVPGGLTAAGGLTLIVSAIRWLQARVERVLPDLGLSRKRKVEIRRDDAAKRLTVPIEALLAGDELALRPGEDVPVDGVIVSGSGFVDETQIVGAALPAPKQPGDALLAGSTATIPDLVMRVAAPFDASLLLQREERARAVVAELARPGRADQVLAAVSAALALGCAGVVIATTALDAVELWLPAVAGALLGCAGAAAPLARAATRVWTLVQARQAGLIVTRAKDVLALGAVRRWQMDAALLAAPGEIEIAPLADVAPGDLLRVAEALMSVEPGPEHLSLRTERERKKLAPASAAALRKAGSMIHGTIDGQRWYLGSERAIADEEPDALDPTMNGPIEFLRDRGLIPWLAGRPGDGVLGAIGIGFNADLDAKTAAARLGATIMPGPPDITRQALAEAAKIRCDGPPLGKRDATLLDRDSPQPSAGLRIRVMPVGPMELESDRCPRLFRPSLVRFSEVIPALKTARRVRELRAGVALLAPVALVLLAHVTGVLNPLTGTAIGLLSLRLAMIRF